MIQRIQTVWLLLAAACAVATYKFAFYTGTNAKGVTGYELNATENVALMAVTGIIVALAFFNIFLFKKRSLQLRLCILLILLEAVVIWLYYREAQKFTTGTYALTAILHGVNVLLFFLAAKGIHNDSKIVKESDRLR
jgi:hypothetical protein